MNATGADNKDMNDGVGNLFVVSAPSGAGKTTLCSALRQAYPDLRYSISHTTRPPRPGESNGVDYYFTTEAAFLRMRDQGQWAEWAKVHGHYYGTSMQNLDQTLAQGGDILLDIDVQGTRQLLQRYPDAVTIFIMAPSLAILRQRLQNRATDDPDSIDRRLRNAQKEIAQKSIYRHVIVNDILEDAINAFIQIVAEYRRKRRT
jgi:guanylate kinase